VCLGILPKTLKRKDRHMPVKYVNGNPNCRIWTRSTKEEIDQYWYKEQQRRLAGKHTGTVGFSANVIKSANLGKKAEVEVKD